MLSAGPLGPCQGSGGAVRTPLEAGAGWLGQYGGCFESPAARPSSPGTPPCPWFWLLEREARGVFGLTHGAPRAAQGSGGPRWVVAWSQNLLCGIFREVEFGPGEGELILEQMTREITGNQDLGMLRWAGAGSGTPSLSVPRVSEPVSPSPQVCCIALSAKLWPAGGAVTSPVPAEAGAPSRPSK